MKTINLLLAFLILCALTGIALEANAWDAPKVDTTGHHYITTDPVELANGLAVLRISLGPDCLKPSVRTIEWDYRTLEAIGLRPVTNGRLYVEARVDREGIWAHDDALVNVKRGDGTLYTLDMNFPASFLTELRQGSMLIFRAGEEEDTAYRFSMAGSNAAINKLVEACFAGEWDDTGDEWGV